MVKKKPTATALKLNGTTSVMKKDLIKFLKSHPKLANCKLEDLGNSNGIGRLIWARNPGSVYWPALIASFEDKPGDVPAGTISGSMMPDDYRSVVFLETAFRIAVLQWKDIILVDENNFDEQVELIYQLNINIIKRTWRREKPYKDAVQLLKEFISLDITLRQAHAFQLSLEHKHRIALLKPRKSESKVKVEDVETENNLQKVKKRHSDAYGLRPSIPPTVITLDDTDSVINGSSSHTDNRGARNIDTPSPSVSSVSETLSDVSRKHKQRPKVGGFPMKEYVEKRFMSMDKSLKFVNNVGWKCAECLDSIIPGEQVYCHDLPHHSECLISVFKNSKDGSTMEQLKCKCCAEQACYICKMTSIEDEKSASKCSKCELRYHRRCLLGWPQSIVQGSYGPITCPIHFCHTCVGEHYVLRKVRNIKAFSKDSRFRCLQCPTTYHKPHCLPAGCGEELSGRDFVICPKHVLPTLKILQRRFGCLTCGKNLKATDENRVDCHLCLQVFHPECVGYSEEHIKNGISLKTFGRDYKCSSCFWGLFPLYGQPVWFQQPGNKFWPARTLFPRESSGRYDFCKGRELGLHSIKYFGSDQSYYDKASRTSPLSLATVKLFTTVKVYEEQNLKVKSAFDEAGFYATLLDEMRDKLLPEPEPIYKRIDRNIYRNSVNTTKKNHDNMSCYCGDAKNESPVCTPNSGCHNRDTAIECNDDNCSGGDRCENRMFTQNKKDYSENTQQFLTPGKGWAVKALKDFKEGDFVIEYCGEIINNAEMQYRANRKTEEDPLYILEIDKHTFIDAEFCGNISRLINHSCEPNCQIEKYTSEGKPVVGVFARTSIAKYEELTFDYAYGNNSSAPFRCHCGTLSCRGYIGKQVALSELEVVDIINPELERYDKECAKCFFGGHVLCCDYEDCYKVYHKSCAGLNKEPNDEWFCPDHDVRPAKAKNKKRKATSRIAGGPPTKKILLHTSSDVNQNGRVQSKVVPIFQKQRTTPTTRK
ncbi:histone-lysine N-methyltransferase NSD2 [Folsomia candida]|uniref:histone-lysine N-methyltransferase NSD2 n=1 Tax=Folsomia candida TaxID=158441 RepID=UPI000B8F7D42|nr:histone-lysine N-methyltransferase NSD2 [Folsomia candida]